MTAWNKIKQKIATEINAILGTELTSGEDLIIPPNQEMGDLGLALFSLSKKLGKNPNEISDQILNNIKYDEIITGAKTVGPYLNFFISKEYLVKSVLDEIASEKENYGKAATPKNEKIILEYSNGNTHKEFHVGHLRNICYGDALTKILNATGNEAIPVSYINDFGIHVAKTLWDLEAYEKENLNGKKLDDFSEDERGFLLGKIYVDASTKEKDDPIATGIIGGWKQKIEGRNGEEYALWQKTRLWSIAHFASVYQDLGISFRETFYESDLVNEGKKIVEDLIAKNILKPSEGAIIADLKDYNLEVLVFVRSNGTATYSVADLALSKAKHEKFHPNVSAVIVDVRQSLYFKQLFKILELAGYQEKLIHLPYDFVKLPSGMMSSRTGNVITYKELKEEILNKCFAETKKRHEDWDDDKIKGNSEKIGYGAMKFEMLKVGAKSIITFDIEKALALEGFTSAYIQYAYARIQSIFRKIPDYQSLISNIKFEKLADPREIGLIKKLALCPDIVEMAGRNYDPSEIAKYIYELAQMLNDYYHAVQVLSAEEDIKNARLALLNSVAQVIKNGLGLLGIETVDEM